MGAQRENTGKSTAAAQDQTYKALCGYYRHSQSSRAGGFLNSQTWQLSLGNLSHPVAPVSSTVKQKVNSCGT